MPKEYMRRAIPEAGKHSLILVGHMSKWAVEGQINSFFT